MTLLKELFALSELKNHMDETEYTTWDSWRKACRKAYDGVTFEGDKDIAQAMYKEGRAVGEWDGAVGVVYKKPAGLKEDECPADTKEAFNLGYQNASKGKQKDIHVSCPHAKGTPENKAYWEGVAKYAKDHPESVKEGFGIKIDGELWMKGDKPVTFASAEEANAAILKSPSMSDKNSKVVPLNESPELQALGKGLKGTVGTKPPVAVADATDDAEVKTDVNTPPAEKAAADAADDETSSSEFKVGDKVMPNAGPHKGQTHSVIHVFPDGRVNLRPDGLKPDQIKYRLGAVTARADQVTLAEQRKFTGSLLSQFSLMEAGANKDGFMPMGYGPKKGHTIEAYGRKGMKNTMWRKMFKSQKELEKWLDDNDATLEGSRDLEDREKR